MPLIHIRPFRVRHYECDAYGHLNNANYLRYMQEAAFDASAAAGFDLARYAQMERLWLIRETEVEFLRPLQYDDRVEVKTWVADFRRVISRRNYEFYLQPGDELAARAWTDWVFMDTRAGRPTRIPPEVIAGFYPEGAPEEAVERPPFPTPPGPPEGAYRMRRQVRWQDLDRLQHVNNAVYLAYASDCGFEATAAFGWSWERLQAAGLGIFLRRLHVQYLQSALLNDELEIVTWIYDVRRATFMRRYEITRARDGARLAQIDAYNVWVDLPSGQPARIPAQMRQDFAPHIA